MPLSTVGYVLALTGFLITAVAALAGHWVNVRGHRIFRDLDPDEAEDFIHGLDILTRVASFSGALLLAGSIVFFAGSVLVLVW